MAVEDELNDIEGKNTSKKSRMTLIIISLVVLLLLSTAAFFFFALSDDADSASDEEQSEQTDVPLEVEYVSIHENFVSHVKSDGRQRYLKLSVQLVIKSDELEENKQLVTKHLPLMKGEIALWLPEIEYETTQSLEGRKQMQQELLIRLNTALSPYTQEDILVDILFTSFVMQ